MQRKKRTEGARARCNVTVFKPCRLPGCPFGRADAAKKLVRDRRSRFAVAQPEKSREGHPIPRDCATKKPSRGTFPAPIASPRGEKGERKSARARRRAEERRAEGARTQCNVATCKPGRLSGCPFGRADAVAFLLSHFFETIYGMVAQLPLTQNAPRVRFPHGERFDSPKDTRFGVIYPTCRVVERRKGEQKGHGRGATSRCANRVKPGRLSGRPFGRADAVAFFAFPLLRNDLRHGRTTSPHAKRPPACDSHTESVSIPEGYPVRRDFPHLSRRRVAKK